MELPRLASHEGCFASYCARSIDGLSGRTSGRLRLGYVRPHSAYAIGGTAKLVLHPTTGPRHFPGDYGPAELLEQGQRRSIRRSRRTVLRDYGPREAASSRRRAVGTTGPFQGPRADREQRTPLSTLQGPQYHSRNYGPGWIRRTALPEYTAASGRHDHATFWERVNESV